MRKSLTAVALTAALALTACSSPAAPSGQPSAKNDKPVAMATTTQLGSVLNDIVTCAGGTSKTLMPPNADPHEFALASNQVADLHQAKLVVANGLGLEGGMASTLKNLAADGVTVFEVGEAIDPLEFGHKEGDHQHHGSHDPHFWLSAARMSKAADAIGAKLAETTKDARYKECGTKVAGDLTKVNEQVKTILADVPAGKRVLVTDHEAFNYFAKEYNFKVAGIVIPSGAAEAAPSSAELAKIVASVKQSGASAIFSNNAASPKLAEAIKAESGNTLSVVRLSVGSLGPVGSETDTYSKMMISNAKTIASALKG